MQISPNGDFGAEKRLKTRNSIVPPTSATTQQFSNAQLQREQAQPFVEIAACFTCGSKQAIQVPGKGPHHAALRCAGCGRFVKWLAKPKSGGGGL
jgi:hypothetical protein